MTMKTDTLRAAALPVDPSRVWLRDSLLVVVGALLLTVSAKVQLPFWPVPMTMQTMAVLLIGMSFGTRLAAVTVAFYLLQGALGLPVFAGTPERGIGLAYMVGPTGGYLMGFLVAAVLLGWMAERGWDRSIGRALLAMCLGHAVILGAGVLWLAVLLGWETAVTAGLTPFWTATILKTALGAALMQTAWRCLGSGRPRS